MRRRKWTKWDTAGILLCIAVFYLLKSRIDGAYQSCIRFQDIVAVTILLVIAACFLIYKFGDRRIVPVGIGLAFALEIMAVYHAFPPETYAEGRETMADLWLGGYEDVEPLDVPEESIMLFTRYGSQNILERIYNSILWRSGEPVIRHRLYVYVFGADEDIAICVYHSNSDTSRFAVLEDMRSGDWEQALRDRGFDGLEWIYD